MCSLKPYIPRTVSHTSKTNPVPLSSSQKDDAIVGGVGDAIVGSVDGKIVGEEGDAIPESMGDAFAESPHEIE